MAGTNLDAGAPAPADDLVLRFIRGQGSYQVLDRGGRQIASLPATEVSELLPPSDQRHVATEALPADVDRLFASIFRGEVLARLEAVSTAATLTTTHVRLSIDLEGAAELEELAWERLGASGMAAAIEVVRTVASTVPAHRQLVRPIDILAVLPRGPDSGWEAERRWAGLRDAAGALCADGSASITRLPSARMIDIEQALAGHAFQALHFIGSGRSEPRMQTGVLVLEGEDGGPRKVDAAYFSGRLAAYPHLQLLVLEPSDSGCGVNPFAIAARTLVGAGRSAVVALRHPLTGSGSGTWVGPLYASLARGLAIDRSLAAARQVLAQGGDNDDWASPILYAMPAALGPPQAAGGEQAPSASAGMATGGTTEHVRPTSDGLRDVALKGHVAEPPPAPPPPAVEPPVQDLGAARQDGALRRVRRSRVDTILLLSADPSDTTRLRLDEELREIQIKLQQARERDHFRLEYRLAVRPPDLQQAIIELRPRFVHFCGHGAGESGLALESDSGGGTQLVPTKALADLFKLVADEVECVVLNSCHSEIQAKAIGAHIRYVVGMRSAIDDRTAIKFATFFYFALGSGYSVPRSFDAGCIAIEIHRLPGEFIPTLLSGGAASALNSY